MNDYIPELHLYKVNNKPVPSVTEICSPITAGKYDGGQGVIKAAAARGTMVHELCELYDYDALPEEIDGDAVPYVQAYISFVKTFCPEWEHIEHRMWADDFAGTADRIGIIDGERVVVDLKTTSSMDIPSKVSLACQLCGYQNLAAWNGINISPYGCQHSMGVQLRNDGTFRVYMLRDIESKYHFNAQKLFENLKEMNQILRRM